VALPFLAMAAFWALLITTIASRGPIFFRQERVGFQGRRFLLYKFRTMHVSASAAPHQEHFSHLMRSNVPMQKLDARGDKRLIPGGWLLRASGLDELPQIINVLKGEMSIVGPRPCIAYEYQCYSEWQRNRLKAMPGLTGLWQVSGKNRTTFDEMVHLDIAYADTLSLAGDIRIMLRTLPALCAQILDTKKARRTAGQPGAAPLNATVEVPGSPNSATFVARSQNVIAGTRVEEHQHVATRQSRQSCVSIRTRSDSAAFGPPAERKERAE
jgi:lipopolysaccharide/colanic/teichoic acid biosynthesis glycosyltransferase